MILFPRWISRTEFLADNANLAFIFKNRKKQIDVSAIGQFVLLSYLFDILRKISDSHIGFLYIAYRFGACGQNVLHFKTPAEEIFDRAVGSEEMSVPMQLFHSVSLDQRLKKPYLHQ